MIKFPTLTTDKQAQTIGIIAVLLASTAFFSYLVGNVETDIQAHNKYIIEINQGKPYPPNFFYYLLLNISTFFSSNYYALSIISTIVLSAAVTAKYFLTKKVIKEYLQSEKVDYEKIRISLIAASLLFFLAIPDFYNVLFLNKFYLGRVVPNVWHNSTTILLFPFALLLFWKQFKIIDSTAEPTAYDLFIVTTLVIANAMIKPSFLFVFVPVSAVFIFLKYRLYNIKQLFLNLLPLIIGGAVIYLLYILVYRYQIGSLQSGQSSIIISKPFEVWRVLVEPFWYIPIAIIFSFALPIAFISFYPGSLKSKLVSYTLSLTFFGIVLSAFICEDGPRKYHGNFLWQNVICCYLLMLVVVMMGISKYLKKEIKTAKKKILITLFILHVLAGISYILKIILTKSYY